MKQTADAAKIERLKAKITAAYQKVKGKELNVTGVYWEFGLSQDAREKIKKGDGFQECRKFIEDNNQRIILAIGLVVFDIKFDENSFDQLAAEINGELAKEGLTSSIAFTFKREVTKKLSATSNNLFQVAIVRHAGIKGKNFVEDF